MPPLGERAHDRTVAAADVEQARRARAEHRDGVRHVAAVEAARDRPGPLVRVAVHPERGS